MREAEEEVEIEEALLSGRPGGESEQPQSPSPVISAVSSDSSVREREREREGGREREREQAARQSARLCDITRQQYRRAIRGTDGSAVISN